MRLNGLSHQVKKNKKNTRVQIFLYKKPNFQGFKKNERVLYFYCLFVYCPDAE